MCSRPSSASRSPGRRRLQAAEGNEGVRSGAGEWPKGRDVRQHGQTGASCCKCRHGRLKPVCMPASQHMHGCPPRPAPYPPPRCRPPWYIRRLLASNSWQNCASRGLSYRYLHVSRHAAWAPGAADAAACVCVSRRRRQQPAATAAWAPGLLQPGAAAGWCGAHPLVTGSLGVNLPPSATASL